MAPLPAPSSGTGSDRLDRDLLLVASVVVLGAIMSILDVARIAGPMVATPLLANRKPAPVLVH